jgi:hypothetical protein
MAHSAITLRAEFPVHRNRTLYSRLATERSSVEIAACYYAFAAPQQALVEDGAAAQHELASGGFDATGLGARSLPYTVFSPNV